MEEKDLDEFFTIYFSKQPSIVKDPDLMESFFLYEALPTEAQLHELHQYVTTIQKPEEKSVMRAKLLDKLLRMAFNRSYNKQSKQLDFGNFNAYVSKFRPDIAEIETQKQKVKYYKNKLDYKKAEVELLLIIESPKLKLGAQQLCKLVKEYSHMLRLSGSSISLSKKSTVTY